MCYAILAHPLFLCQYLAEKEKAKSNFFCLFILEKFKLFVSSKHKFVILPPKIKGIHLFVQKNATDRRGRIVL